MTATDPLHAGARRLLTGWTAPDAHQEALRRDFLALVGERPDALRRTAVPAHLTASALVVDEDADGRLRRVLLVLHRKAGRWLQTGGHAEEGDASLADAALREAREESGIADLRIGSAPVRLDRHPAPCRTGAVEHFDVQYLAVAPAGARPAVSAESLDVAWWDPAALPEPTDAAVRALVAVAREQSAGQSSVAGARVAADQPSRKPRARSVRG